MLLVISPAKTLDFDAEAVTDLSTQPRFLEHSQQLVDKLKQRSAAELASLMKVSDKLAGLNLARFQQWSTPFNSSNAKQAVLAFKGDVYTGLDADTLDKAGFDLAQRRLRILSGLYGVLRPLDLIQAYRLEMGTKFTNNRGRDLYAFWGEQLRESLETEPELADGLLINLASQEYFKAVGARKLSARIITPVFKDWKNGQYKIISFYAKKARGMMARYLIDNDINNATDISEFDDAGYYYCPAQSSANSPVFLRDRK